MKSTHQGVKLAYNLIFMGKNFQKNSFFKNFNEFCESNLNELNSLRV